MIGQFSLQRGGTAKGSTPHRQSKGGFSSEQGDLHIGVPCMISNPQGQISWTAPLSESTRVPGAAYTFDVIPATQAARAIKKQGAVQ